MEKDKRTIMICDDAWENRIILKEIFKNKYNIIEVENGRQVLEILKNGVDVISLILLDLYLPVMNGFEVMTYLKDNPQLSDVPIIVVSASYEEEKEALVLELGAYDFIKKPFDPRIISYRVQNVISRNELKQVMIENARLAEKAKNLELLKYNAERNSVTGLYNAQAFYLAVKNEFNTKPSEQYSIIRIDINRFKIVNDLFGYDVGNNLLRHIAESLRIIFGDGAICGHFEADNFVVATLLDKYNTENIENLLTRITDEIQKFDIEFTIVPCFGLYFVRNFSYPVSLMCDRALIALRTVKGNYIKRYAVYGHVLRDKILKEQQIVNDMKTALDEHQFSIYMQSQHKFNSSKIVGAEALIRWNHPVKGMISPAEFIPVFEKNGFISQVDEFVWEEVCKWIRGRLDNNLPVVPVSVNLSRIDIYNPKLLEKLTGFIEKYSLPVSMLRLEITETAYVENPEQLIDTVKQLQDYGFTIEMDDFGSGYSSLNTLKDVPVDIIKLDIKFLSGEDRLNRGSSILDSVIRMATWLGIPVIAEGVETKQQTDFLKSIGCAVLQGYYFSRPVPVSEFEALLDKNSLINKYEEEEITSYGSIQDCLDEDSDINVMLRNYYSGAGIFEYFNGKLELIRVNDWYYDVVDTIKSFHNNYRMCLDELIEDNDKPLLFNSIQKAIDTKESVTVTVRFIRPISQKESVVLRINMRMVANSVDRYLFFALVDNISQEVKKELKAKCEIQKSNLILDFMNTLTFEYDVENDSLKSILKISGKPEIENEITAFSTADSVINVHADSVDLLRDTLKNACNGDCKGTAEFTVSTDEKNKTFSARRFNYSSVCNDNGDVVKVIAATVFN